MKRRCYITLILCPLLCFSANLQAETMLYLEHAQTLDFDETLHPDAQILRGDVMFKHDDAVMYCDSAYYYESRNSMDAFGNVRMVQGDTLFGYGDKLYYDGNTKFVRFRNNVRLVDKQTILTTDSLNYDRQNDLAWYFSGGMIVDSLNTLTSNWGQYRSGTKQALFKDNVRLMNSRFVMDADTLHYNTESHIANIVGETVIIYEEETTIYSTLGWYNTETEHSMLLNHSLIVNAGGSTMTGDTIYYDKQAGWGKALQNIEMTDSANHITLYGNYGEMYEYGVHGQNSGFATDSAMLVDWSDSTDYTYIHADSLFTEELQYKLAQLIEVSDTLPPDTLWKDTTYRQMRGFYGVRLYKTDLQAVCDSFIYNGRDSIMMLFGSPIAWSDNQQVSAEHIDIYIKNGVVDYAHSIGSALAIEQKHTVCFNQLSGKEMFAYMREGKLRRIDVNGNAETVFYPQEDDGTFVGVNKTQSSFVSIFFSEDGKLEHATFTSATAGTLYPLQDLKYEERLLGGFFWAADVRPFSPDDVFRKVNRN